MYAFICFSTLARCTLFSPFVGEKHIANKKSINYSHSFKEHCCAAKISRYLLCCKCQMNNQRVMHKCCTAAAALWWQFWHNADLLEAWPCCHCTGQEWMPQCSNGWIMRQCVGVMYIPKQTHMQECVSPKKQTDTQGTVLFLRIVCVYMCELVSILVVCACVIREHWPLEKTDSNSHHWRGILGDNKLYWRCLC